MSSFKLFDILTQQDKLQLMSFSKIVKTARSLRFDRMMEHSKKGHPRAKSKKKIFNP